MKNLASNGWCNGCCACADVCPVNCIDITQDEDGFYICKIDKRRCIKCGKCRQVCQDAHMIARKQKYKKAYAAINNNKIIRKNSTSGGIFFALAKYIISKKGYVYGAAYDENMVVRHIEINKYEDLVTIQGSKYVQSYIGNIYKLVEERLKENWVLFSGTPCQVSGLFSYLKQRRVTDRSMQRLLAIDIICHGVPSPKLFEAYINQEQKINNDRLYNLTFRSKESGWKNPSMNLKFANVVIRQPFKTNTYIIPFRDNISLCRSCSYCQFNSIYRLSDITLGDFWGIGAVEKEYDDDKGTSLVLINSDSGENIIKELSKTDIRIKDVSIAKAILHNQNAFSGSIINSKRRKEFYDDFRMHGYILPKYLSNKNNIVRYINKAFGMMKYIKIYFSLAK